jgi:hypothetical protein
VKQPQHFIQEGWATNFNDLITDALRRYLDIYNSELMEHFNREVISWGLNGLTYHHCIAE